MNWGNIIKTCSTKFSKNKVFLKIDQTSLSFQAVSHGTTDCSGQLVSSVTAVGISFERIRGQEECIVSGLTSVHSQKSQP